MNIFQNPPLAAEGVFGQSGRIVDRVREDEDELVRPGFPPVLAASRRVQAQLPRAAY